MASSPREKIEILREHIEGSPDVGEADAERLIEFSDRLEETDDRRHERLLRYCVTIAEETDDGLLAAALDDRDAAEAIVEWIFDTYQADETNRSFRVALRVFGKRLSDDGECPPSIGWVPTSTSADFDVNPGHHV